MVYMEQKNNEKYDLYTEHIVPNTGERIIRGLKRGAMVAVVAVFFGLVAGLVMIIVYQKGTDIISEPTREQVKLPNDYYDNNTNENVTVSTPDDTENAIRDGIFALIKPVITFTDGLCVAMIK